jgi:anti-sigma factor RsiW
MSVQRHQMHEEDVGAYLLRALPDVEQRRFEMHLEECVVCQDEVSRLRPAVNALPRSVYPMTPPRSLKAGLMAEVERDVREREEAAGVSRRSSPFAGMRRRLAGVGGAFGSLRPTVAWVSASVVLLVGVVSGAAGLYAVTDVTDEPSSRSVVAQVDKTRVPFGSGSLVVPDVRQEGAVLRVHGMPELEDDSVYQLWVRRDGEVISQSLFHVGENGDGAAAVTESLEDVDVVMVTRESAGGAKAPSEKPVLSVKL